MHQGPDATGLWGSLFCPLAKRETRPDDKAVETQASSAARIGAQVGWNVTSRGRSIVASQRLKTVGR